MIPQQFIIEWSGIAPWKANEQIEQDLIISRSLVELFSDRFIADRLAFRGGSALLHPDETYDPKEGFDLVKKDIIEKM